MADILEFPSGNSIGPIVNHSGTLSLKTLPEVAVIPCDKTLNPTIDCPAVFMVTRISRDDMTNLCSEPYAYFVEQSLAQAYAYSLSEQSFLTLPDLLIKELAEQAFTF